VRGRDRARRRLDLEQGRARRTRRARSWRRRYQLSKGNPIQDTKELLSQLREYVKGQGATLDVLGFGATGYAADVLEECVRAT
jgi:activator of 2-hydroxyglutaryl-CoA dehydratase